MSAEDTLRATLIRLGAAPEQAERLAAENTTAARRARATIRGQVLREAGDVADELIAGLDRTGDPDSIVKADAYRAYSDRLHELADGEPQPGRQVRTRTFGFPGQDPFLTVRMVFGPDLTDAGVDAVAEQIGTAARLAVGMTAVDVAERGNDTRGACQAPTGESTQPASDGPVERVTVYLAPASSTALTRAAQITGDTKTDTINRAIQTYALMASEVDGGGRVLLQHAAETSPAPDFFQPGHTYARDSHGATVEFLVTHISTAPDGSGKAAFGWHRVEGYGTWSDYTSDDLGGWADTTEVGEPRG